MVEGLVTLQLTVLVPGRALIKTVRRHMKKSTTSQEEEFIKKTKKKIAFRI